MGKLYCITSYQVGSYLLDFNTAVFKYTGHVWRDTRIPSWKLGHSGSYRVWNYVWGEDPDA